MFFVLFPNLATVLIAISRVNDYQHRWVDIIGAAFVGVDSTTNLKLHLSPDSIHVVERRILVAVYCRRMLNQTANRYGASQIDDEIYPNFLFQKLLLFHGLQGFRLRTSVTDSISRVSMLDHGVSFQIKFHVHVRMF